MPVRKADLGGSTDAFRTEWLMDFHAADRPTLERMLADPRFGEPMKDRIRARLATLPTTKAAPAAAPAISAHRKSEESRNSGALEQIAHFPGALRLTLFGPPRTKKTSNRLVVHQGRRKVIPSEAWCAWRDAIAATNQIPEDVQLPDRPYRCIALFFRQADVGDLVGYQQGLADVLEESGVISNDKWIRSWDGTRLLVDRACPRVELVLTPMED